MTYYSLAGYRSHKLEFVFSVNGLEENLVATYKVALSL
jgi:hypothetical protein